MKTLKFRSHLVKEIQEGRKTVTWRLFDDKDLSLGDQLSLITWETRQRFAKAEITKIREKKLGQIEETDFEGHEKYASLKDMLNHYREYYGDGVTEETLIKMIDFRVVRFLK